MSFREWLKRLFERAQPVWEGDAELAPVKAKPARKAKAKKKAKKK